MKPIRPMIRLAVLGLAAAGFATLAVILAERHVAQTVARQQAAMRAPEPATVAVVVAKFDMVAGEAVGPDNMAIRRIPADFAPGSALRPEQFDAKVGMRLARALRSGEPLLAEILQSAESAGLASKVKQGIRAVTISVDDVNSVSGMLRPGDRIDLIFSARAATPDTATAVESARVLIQDVPVLATGRQVRSSTDDAASRAFTSITVELSPDDAKRLIVAQRTGRITALLRNPDDRHPVSTAVLDANALLGVRPGPTPQAVRVAAPAGPEVIVGGSGGLSVGRTVLGQDSKGLPEADALVRSASARIPLSSSGSPAAPSARPLGIDQPATPAAAPVVPPSVQAPTQPILFR